MLQAVIMAGGSGTRFWPLSRTRFPKQFLMLHGSRSLIQQAYDRIEGLVGREGVLVITNQLQVAKTREQLPELTAERIIGEPCGRDTAPCIGLAAELLRRSEPDARMIVLAADHLIPNLGEFHQAVRTADEFASEHPDALLTFGIPPSRPATGYGYLRRERRVGGEKVPVYKLHSFHEKPNLTKAEEYLASGEYFWNSGIFLWRADTILEEIGRCAPALREAISRISDAWDTSRQQEVFSSEYESLTKVSIDYAVMEKAREVYMVEAPFIWDDVGSWLALERVLPRTEEGNIVIGKHEGLRSSHCVIVSGQEHLISTLGTKDLIIVHTPDVTLVADRREEESVKELLKRLEELGLEEYL